MKDRCLDGFAADLQKLRILALIVCLPILQAAAAPPTAISTQERGYLARVALARARTAMLQRVRDLTLRGTLSIGDWVDSELQLSRALHQWVRTRAASGATRVFSDGTSDADVCVTPEALSAVLSELRKRPESQAAAKISSADLKRFERDTPILWTTGSASLTERGDGRRWAG